MKSVNHCAETKKDYIEFEKNIKKVTLINIESTSGDVQTKIKAID